MLLCHYSQIHIFSPASRLPDYFGVLYVAFGGFLAVWQRFVSKSWKFDGINWYLPTGAKKWIHRCYQTAILIPGLDFSTAHDRRNNVLTSCSIGGRGRKPSFVSVYTSTIQWSITTVLREVAVWVFDLRKWSCPNDLLEILYDEPWSSYRENYTLSCYIS